MISEGSCDTKDWTNGYILYTLNGTEVNRSHYMDLICQSIRIILCVWIPKELTPDASLKG